MNVREQALVFPCEGEELIGVVAAPDDPGALGVLVIVGGPQYRAGSHRQFVLLARAVAQAGYAALRFDYRGMGDSSGPMRSFEQIDRDIGAAVDAFLAATPAVNRVALWGLCDAASAAMMYAPGDARVAGIAMLNPWARSEQTIAGARVKHYYLSRLAQREFWSKLRRGKLSVAGSLQGVLKDLSLALRPRRPDDAPAAANSFQARMARGLRTFAGPVLAVFSGKDLTAKEFLGVAASDAQWTGLLQSPRVARFDLDEADHTFSREEWRLRVEALTIEWLHRVAESVRREPPADPRR